MYPLTPLPLLALCALAPFAHAAETAPAPAAKKTYSPVFAPVAIEDRRALSVDRSNFTYAPSGINSGVLQLETSLIEYTQDDKIPNTAGQYKQFNFGTATIRAGILDNWEVKATLASHVSARLKDATGAVTQQDGLGDLILESRYTLAGNNGEAVGIALMPYVKLPTNTLNGFNGAFNDKVEFGMQAPLGYSFTDKLSVCAAPGFDVNYNGQSAHAYDVNPFLSTAFWYTAIPNSLYLFNEWYIKKNTGLGKDDLNSYVGLGGVYQFNNDCALDFGVNLGLSEVAADLYARVGVTYRF